MEWLRGWPAAALVLAGVLAGAAGPPPKAQRMVPGGRAGFVTDGVGGCWVWVGGIAAGVEPIIARWSGGCPDGPAEGEGRSDVRWSFGGRDRQMLFEGTLRGGKAEGQGRLTHLDAGQPTVIEEGEYRRDEFVGGRFSVLATGLVYEGGWRLGGPHGQGRATIRGQVFEGLWENGCLRRPQGWMSFTRPAEQCEGQPT